LFKGGARIFGPQPRDYSFKLNKKVKDLAKFSALSTKMAASAIKVVEDFNFDQPKTKEFIAVLKGFGLENKKTLLILPELNDNVYLSSRNLKNTSIGLANSLNTYEIMNNNTILIAEKSIETFEK